MSALISEESRSLPLILIVDKIGVIGQALAQEFSKDYLVVFASSGKPPGGKNIIHIPFKRRIPQVPDNNYSKIFVLDDGESVTRQSVFSFISKARESSSPFYFIGSIRNIDIEHADELTRSYANAKALVFGDLFDKKIFFDRNSSINRFILESRKNLKIGVPGNGLSLSFPISFSDTIKLIVKASEVETSQKVILLFNPHPITDISLANTFKKVNPDIRVDFIKGKKERKIYIPSTGVHAISKYDIEEKIRELDLEDLEDREVKVAEDKKKGKSFLKPIVLFLLITAFLVLLPPMTMASYLLLGQREMNSAKTLAGKGEFALALKKANNSKTFFETAEKTSKIVSSELRLIGKEEYLQKVVRKIDSEKTIAASSIYIIEGGDIIKKIMLSESKDPKNDFSKALNLLKSAVALIQKIKAEGNLPEDLEKSIRETEPFIDLFSNSSDVLLGVLGFEKEKTYLVLLQDNMELRPGGGLIAGVATLTVANGKIKDFEVQSSSEVDKLLKAHVEPPFAIRRYLSSKNLYLKDSNFDPDFVDSAISSANMYSLETGKKVDGVIGTDMDFAKNILSVIGEVTVEGQKVNSENLYKVAIPELARSIEQGLKNKKGISFIVLASALGKSIKEKHLTFAFQDLDVQNIFTANNWSSSLWDNRKDKDGLINDYFGLIEANLGGNKVNYFVSRSVAKKLIIFDDGRVSSKATIGFKNNSAPGGGNYKNYIQLVLPEGAKITEVKIDNKESEIEEAITDFRVYESGGFRPPRGFEIEEKREFGKSVFGFLISVAPGQVKSIAISYDLPYSVPSSSKSVDYSLRIYKQPGIDSYPMDLSFSIPFTYKLIDSSENVSWQILSDEDFSFRMIQN